MAITTDTTGLGQLLKTWYTEKGVENLLFRNSPVLKAISKSRVGGEEYAFASMYGSGGNITASHTKAVANAASSARNAQFKVAPGQLFTAYNVSKKEILATEKNKGSFLKAQTSRFFAANENIRKGLAATLYGFGYGEIGRIQVAVPQGGTSFVFNDASMAIKIDVGTKFQVTDGSTGSPGDALLGTTYTVTKVDGLAVTFTPAVVEAGGFSDAGFICYEGGRSGSTPLFPQGLAAWVPSIVAGRTGAAWDDYISTPFHGVDRSVATDRLAGQYVQRAAAEKFADAVVRGVRAVRRAGGVPNMIIVNDEDYATIISEIEAQTSYWQSTNSGGDSKKKNSAAKGMEEVSFMFSTSWVKDIYDDPYCPKGTAYILDMDVVELISLGGAPMTDDGISGNNPGTPDVESEGDGPGTNYDLMVEDYITVKDGADTDDGPAMEISMQVYANFVIHNTAHACVIDFDAP
jgi:hypothetical protein